MVKVIVTHRVKDYAKWRPYFDADAKRRQEAGFNNINVYRPVDDPNNLHIIGEANNVTDVENMFKNQDLEKVMEQAGVISEPEVTVLNPT